MTLSCNQKTNFQSNVAMNPQKPVNRGSNLTQRRIFLSCASHEFRSYRDALSSSLTQPGVEVRRQEDFVNSGLTTLEKLDAYIHGCDAVIHLIGDSVGSYPSAPQVNSFLSSYPDFVAKLEIDELLESPGLSYTQWEAWLAIYHGKPLGIYRAADRATREMGFASDPAQVDLQFRHWQHLKNLGRDRKEFITPQDLSIEVLRALPLMIPGFSENVRSGQFRDRNLLFAVLALQDEILTRENFVRVCTLWGGDSNRNIAEMMCDEGLLSTADRQLVEARLERKLKHRGGDIRQSLAESLGGDARQTLGDALDPAMLAFLPNSVTSHPELRLGADSWRYRLTRTHGQGGLGVVSVAEDASLDRSVAVKQLRAERMLDPMAIERFIREARITGNLQHPNIIPVYELGLSPGDQVPFYAMRFVGHRTLMDVIRQYHADKKASEITRNLHFRELLQSYVAVCNAVAFAHSQGIIHRDLKPENVMIGDFGEVILLDWGLAKHLGEEEIPLADEYLEGEPNEESDNTDAAPEQNRRTLAGARLGTPAYMSPEQAAGLTDFHGTHTDIYGLGVILYEILTGELPFHGTSTDDLLESIETRQLRPPREVNSACPAPLAAVCSKAQEKQPPDRYATAALLAEDIQRWLADEPVSVFRENVLDRLKRFNRKNPGPVAAGAAAVLMGIIGLTLGLAFLNGERKRTELARQEAEANFREARKTVDSFVTDISRDELSVIPGLQATRQKFAERAVARYEDYFERRPRDPEVIVGLAQAKLSLGQVIGGIGSYERALKLMNEGIRLLEQNNATDSSRAQKLRFETARLDLGKMYWTFGDYNTALEILIENNTELSKLSVADSADLGAKFQLAKSYNLLGNCLSDETKQHEAYVNAKKSAQTLVGTTHPDQAGIYTVLAAATHNMKIKMVSEKNYWQALEYIKESAVYDNKVLELTPSSPDALSNASIGMQSKAEILYLLDKKEESTRAYEQALKSARLVAEANPKVTRLQWLLADTLQGQARHLSTINRYVESQQMYEESCQILEKLVNLSDDRHLYATTLIKNRCQLASFLAGDRAGKKDAAGSMEQLRQAKAAGDKLLRKFPNASALIYQCGNANFQIGNLQKEAGNNLDALASFREAIKLYKNGQTRAQGNQDAYQQADFLNWVLKAVETCQTLNLSEETFTLIDLGTKLGTDCPTQDGKQTLSVLYSTKGSILSKAGKSTDAIEAYKTAQAIVKPAWEDAKWHWYLRSSVAGNYFNLIVLYQSANMMEDELRARQEWLRIWGEPLHSIKSDGLLDPNAHADTILLSKLRKAMESSTGMKRFTIPCDFNGVKYPFHVYVTNVKWPTDPLEDQAKWLEEIRGGTIPKDVRESFQRLHKIAHENNVSFIDLCVYALGTAAAEEGKKVEVENPKTTETAIKESEAAMDSFQKGDFQKAQKLWQLALDLNRAAPDKNPLDVLLTRMNIAACLVRLNKAAEARDGLTKLVLEIDKERPRTLLAARAKHYFAMTLVTLGEPGQAQSVLREAIGIYKKLPLDEISPAQMKESEDLLKQLTQ